VNSAHNRLRAGARGVAGYGVTRRSVHPTPRACCWGSPRSLIGMITLHKSVSAASATVSTRKSQRWDPQTSLSHVSRPAAALASAQPCFCQGLERILRNFFSVCRSQTTHARSPAHSRILLRPRQQPTAADTARTPIPTVPQ
jgi:hypothetical protein